MGKIELEFKGENIHYEVTGDNEEDIKNTVFRFCELLKIK